MFKKKKKDFYCLNTKRNRAPSASTSKHYLPRRNIWDDLEFEKKKKRFFDRLLAERIGKGECV